MYVLRAHQEFSWTASHGGQATVWQGVMLKHCQGPRGRPNLTRYPAPQVNAVDSARAERIASIGRVQTGQCEHGGVPVCDVADAIHYPTTLCWG